MYVHHLCLHGLPVHLQSYFFPSLNRLDFNVTSQYVLSCTPELQSDQLQSRKQSCSTSWDESQPGNINAEQRSFSRDFNATSLSVSWKVQKLSSTETQSTHSLHSVTFLLHLLLKKPFKQFILFKICWSSLRYKLSSEKWDNMTLIVHFKSCVVCNSEVNNLFFQHLSQILLFWEPCTIMTVQSRCC